MGTAEFFTARRLLWPATKPCTLYVRGGCQRRTGSLFAAQARFPSDSVQLSGASTAYVRVGEEGCRTTFHFCPHCSAIVYYQREGDADTIIPVGVFADPSFPAPTRSVWEEDQHPWVCVRGDIEHLA